MDSHTFAGEYQDPGSQNVAEPKDPNPKQWTDVIKQMTLFLYLGDP